MLSSRTGRPSKRSRLVVRLLNASSVRGHLQFGGLCVPCAIGRAGVRVLKREGDGATPRGMFCLRRVLYRPGKGSRPLTALSLGVLRKSDGWCDAPGDRNYNRAVSLPYPQSAERLWRDDRVYDLIVVLGYNDVPRVRNRGSAIFMHVARPGFPPTEGCIALRARDLRHLLGAIPGRSTIRIQV